MLNLKKIMRKKKKYLMVKNKKINKKVVFAKWVILCFN